MSEAASTRIRRTRVTLLRTLATVAGGTLIAGNYDCSSDYHGSQTEPVTTTGSHLLAPQAAYASGVEGSSTWKAIDGLTSTRWTSGATQTACTVPCTASVPGTQWLAIDMTSQQTFTEVDLDTTSDTSDFPGGWDVQVSNDGVNWTDVTSGTQASAPAGNVTAITFPAQTAEYILVFQTAATNSHWWSVDELRVYNGTTLLNPSPQPGTSCIFPLHSCGEYTTQSFCGNDSGCAWNSGTGLCQQALCSSDHSSCNGAAIGAACGGSSGTCTAFDCTSVNPAFVCTPDAPGSLGSGAYCFMPWLLTSSYQDTFAAANGIDQSPTTRFSSNFSDSAWFEVDLGSTHAFDEIQIYWERAMALEYVIEQSNDGYSWMPLTAINSATQTIACPPAYGSNCYLHDLTNLSGNARYIRMQGGVRNSQYGYSFWEFHVFSNGNQLAVTNPPPQSGPNPSGKRGTAFHLCATTTNCGGTGQPACGWQGVSAGQHDIDAFKSGTKWTYDWSDRPGDCVQSSSDLTGSTPNVEFVPMVWGWDGTTACNPNGDQNCKYIQDCVDNNAANCVNKTRAQVVSDINILGNAKYLLGYNEPDFQYQSGLTPKAAAAHWADLEYIASQYTNGAGPSGHLALVGPAVNYCDNVCSTPNAGCCTLVSGDNYPDPSGTYALKADSGTREGPFQWLEHFYDECRATYTVGGTTYAGVAGHNCEIDFQAVHSYSYYGIWSIQPLKIKAGTAYSPYYPPTASHCSNAVKDADEDATDCGGEDCAACDPNVRAIFAKQVWLTEFAPDNTDCWKPNGTACGQDPYTMSLNYEDYFVGAYGQPGSGNVSLEADPYVFRYAWFMPKISPAAFPTLGHASLFLYNDTADDPTKVSPIPSSSPSYVSSSVVTSVGTEYLGLPNTTLHALSRTGWTVTATKTDTTGDVASNVLDGNTSTRWSSGAAQSAGSVTFTVNMGSPQAFKQITLDTSNGSFDFARNYSVDVSTNGSSWTNIISGGRGIGSYVIIPVSLGSNTYQYFRVKQNTSSNITSWWSIYELNVWN